MQPASQIMPISEHFALEQVADGVYAAVGIKGGAAFSNAGIVDLGDRTIVFDTFETPRAAKDLRIAAEGLTERPVTAVIISHDHPDHWLGNQVFADHAPIISTHRIREGMLGMQDEFESTPEALAEWDSWIQEQNESLKNETDPRSQKDLEASIARWQYMREALPRLELVFPSQTFEQKLVFHGTQRTAELLTRGAGHTASDCFLVLPSDKVAFIGDLGFFHRQPFMPFCDPQAWVVQLETLEGSDIQTFVPGHGPVGTKAELALQRQYIEMLEKLVSQAVQGGKPVEAILEKRLPPPFDDWSAKGTPLDANVHFFYQRLAGSSE